MKHRIVGGLSFGSEQAYQEFLSQDKEEQTERVYNSLNPKDYKQAEAIVSKLPKGDDSKGTSTESTGDNVAGLAGGNPKGDSKKSRTAESKG